jgi:hypothetical protein
MSTHGGRLRSDLRLHTKQGHLALKPMQEKRGKSSLNWHGQARRLRQRFMTKPRNLDLKGLGAKLCELLGARSGHTIAFHVLQDGSVRVINCSIAPDKLKIICPAI